MTYLPITSQLLLHLLVLRLPKLFRGEETTRVSQQSEERDEAQLVTRRVQPVGLGKVFAMCEELEVLAEVEAQDLRRGEPLLVETMQFLGIVHAELLAVRGGESSRRQHIKTLTRGSVRCLEDSFLDALSEAQLRDALHRLLLARQTRRSALRSSQKVLEVVMLSAAPPRHRHSARKQALTCQASRRCPSSSRWPQVISPTLLNHLRSEREV
eukprot:768797-Hanusia_phi.AAC.8